MVTEDNLLGSEFFIYSMVRATTDLQVRYSQVYINRTWVRIIFQGYRLIVWKLHNFFVVKPLQTNDNIVFVQSRIVTLFTQF